MLANVALGVLKTNELADARKADILDIIDASWCIPIFLRPI